MNFITQEPDIVVPADIKTLMHVFSLQPLEAKFLQAMLASKTWVGKDELPAIKYSIRQIVFKMRAKLDPLHIVIINDGAGKYALLPDSKLVAKRMIEQALTPRVMAG